MGMKWMGLVALVVVGGVTTAAAVAPSSGPEPTVADSDEDPNRDDDQQPPPAIDNAPPPRDHFTLYPAGDNALSYEELDEREKRSLDDSAYWAESGNGHAVHSGWSGVARKKRNKARAKKAAHLSGVNGLENLGTH